MNRLLFAETDSRNIGLFRLLFCLALGHEVYERDYHILIDTRVFDLSGTIAQFPLYTQKIGGTALYDWFRIGCSVFLALTGLGILPRLFAPLSCLTYFLYFYPVDSIVRPYDNHMIFFILFVLAFTAFAAPSPGLDAFSLPDWLKRAFQRETTKKAAPRSPIWPLQAVRLCLGLVYFDAATSKLWNTGLSWFSGHTMQNYLLERSVVFHGPFNTFVASHLWACQILSTLSLFAELTFVSVVFFPSLVPLVAPTGLLMHLGIYLTMGLNFFHIFALAYLSFVTPFRLRRAE